MRVLLLALFCLTLLAPEARAQEDGQVLVFTRTTGFRHASIADGIAAIQRLGAEHGFSVLATENPADFNPATLGTMDAVVFLNTTGDVLNDGQQVAFRSYVESGGGFVGIHAAADTEYDWPWYGALVGAYFESHPPGTPTATVKVVDRVHPATSHLPASWGRTDEWYNYRSNPRGSVHVLATLDEQTYSGGTMRGDHPIAWCQAFEGGRSFYTGGGHTSAAFSEDGFEEHLWGGLSWAAGWEPGNCTATVETSWEKTVLDADVNDPIELAVAPSGLVFFVERGGAIKVWDPQDGGHTHLMATLPVTTSYEDGLLGITLDPDFAENGWAYLYYSPLSEAVQRVSRFTITGETIDLGSESILLTVPTDRDEGGHSGGSLTFGPGGLLYIATGDDAVPFASDGYAPIDERPGRASWDAQRTSGNPFDLRGKVLRIRPLADGTASIPEGNLFPADGSQGRPEVFVMGVRNPFRISVDPDTGWLYWGDVGPDANDDNGARGPRGYDEFNQARTAGHFGWPYCIADNRPYRDFNFASGASGPAYICAATVNDSPNVSQAPVTLPPAQPAWAYYPYAPSPEFPDLPNGGGRTAMAGPVVRASTPGGAALPAYFDGAAFFYDWSRNWIVETHLDASGQPLAFQRFLPSLRLNRPIDLELGPDGALYFLEWGTGFGGGNPDASLSRISYASNGRAPIARAQGSPTSGPAPLAVTFTSTGTTHPEALPLEYAWDLDGDGSTDATTPEASATYTENGTVMARLTVTDTNGLTATANVTILVGNSRPVVTVAHPADGGFFAWGDSLRFEVSVTDPEDGSTDGGTINCADLVVQPGIGHDDHNHPLEEYAACTGSFRAPEGHGADAENVFLVLDASYTDSGAEGAGALTGRRQVVLRPMRIEAEHYARISNAVREPSQDLTGNESVRFAQADGWIAFEPVNLEGISFLSFRVGTPGSGGSLEARVDSPNGPLVAAADIAPTGGLYDYRDLTVPVTNTGGTHTLYIVFRSPNSIAGPLALNWVNVHGTGVAVAQDIPRGLIGEYFASPDFTGAPVTRTDPQVSFDWAAAAPVEGLPTSGFSVRWRGMLRVPSDGLYRFTTVTDDGARLRLGPDLVVDAWDGAGLRRQSGTTRLTAGEIPIIMEYRDDSRSAEATLLWQGPGMPVQTLREEWLTADPSVTVATASGAESALGLARPSPNPARSAVQIEFRLPTPAEATVELFDVRGRQVMILHDGPTTAGLHTLTADLSGLPAGVYVVRLSTGGERRTRSLTLVR